MKVHELCTAMLLVASIGCSSAFAPSTHLNTIKRNPTFMSLNHDGNTDSTNNLSTLMKDAKDVLSVGMMAALLWSSPGPLLLNNHQDNMMMENIRSSIVADAKEMASGSGSRVNKDAESLLRYGLPIKNKEVNILFSTSKRKYHFSFT